MLGSALLVAPVVEEGATTRKVIFPKNVLFYDFISGEAIMAKSENEIEVKAPLEKCPVFIQAGSIIPYYSEKSVESIKNMAGLRRQPIEIVIAINLEGKSYG